MADKRINTERDRLAKLAAHPEITTVLVYVSHELLAAAAETREFGHSAMPCDLQDDSLMGKCSDRLAIRPVTVCPRFRFLEAWP
jgi:hypothetical protein